MRALCFSPASNFNVPFRLRVPLAALCRAVLAIFLFLCASPSALCGAASDLPWSQRAANAAIARWPEGRIVSPQTPPTWTYELGTLLQGMDDVWLNSANGVYFRYIESSIDRLVAPDGSIPAYKTADRELDSILLGRQLLLLYDVTQNKRYLTAAEFVFRQLQDQPRTPSGGFWHKQRYPNQMWLDGLYMAEPFYAHFASVAHRNGDFADIAHQFVLSEQHLRDPRTGLLYHGWDESRQQRWANPQTGRSSEFWARGMGWYIMALVDTLEYFPEHDPGRAQLLAILAREADAIARVQDPASGLWYDILDKPNAAGNYLESSSSCMFVYAFAKAVRLGYLPPHFLANVERGYKGILDRFIETSGDDVSLTGTVKASGLGGEPYRDGTYAYYMSEKVGVNDAKGVGAFLMASSEMEVADDARLGRGRTVFIDGWFNSQQRTDAFGVSSLFHYKWNTWDEPGYSLFGHTFRNFGVRTAELDDEPTVQNLSAAQIYVVASPDNRSKNPDPHYATQQDARQIAAWVRAGGVLLLFENDSSFADLDRFNLVSQQFGIHFNSVLRKHVEGSNWEQGRIALAASGPIFHRPHTIFVKDVCTISVSGRARVVTSENGDIFMATAKYGKGTVFAMVDPWLYNEYTDGRKLPPQYDNFAAGRELVRWIVEQLPHPQE